MVWSNAKLKLLILSDKLLFLEQIPCRYGKAIYPSNSNLSASFQTLANGVTLCKSGNIRTLHVNGVTLADNVQLIPLADCPHYDIWCSGLINVNVNFNVGILYIDISGHLSIRDSSYNVISGGAWFTVTWIV